MKRLPFLMLAFALTGALAFGTTNVLADDGEGEDDVAACTTVKPSEPESGGDHRALNHDNGDDDEIDGTEDADHRHGEAGDDDMRGEGGDDDLCGDEGDDDLEGGRGDDNLHGGPGNDVIAGQQGDDAEFGDGGSDRISGGGGHDRISGGRGRDHINSRDGLKDRVNCGPAEDTVRADRADAVAQNCEHVSR